MRCLWRRQHISSKVSLHNHMMCYEQTIQIGLLHGRLFQNLGGCLLFMYTRSACSNKVEIHYSTAHRSDRCELVFRQLDARASNS